MRFGVTCMLTDRTIGPAELARAVEDAGLDSLFLPEHTHIPTARATPAPLGEPLPEEYRRVLDPFVALTAAAGATSRIRLGTGIALIAQRDPILTAKEAATLDHLAGGRVTLGVGFGWNVEEMADHGVAFADRRELVREKILAMQQLWTQDEARFDGEHVHLSPSWAWPKPVQSGGLPIWLGASAGATNIAHAVEYADGWIPIGGSGLTRTLPKMRAALADAGRNPDDFDVVPFGSRPTPGKLDHFAGLGVTEVVVLLPSAGRDVVLAALDEAVAVIDGWRG